MFCSGFMFYQFLSFLLQFLLLYLFLSSKNLCNFNTESLIRVITISLSFSSTKEGIPSRWSCLIGAIFSCTVHINLIKFIILTHPLSCHIAYVSSGKKAWWLNVSLKEHYYKEDCKILRLYQWGIIWLSLFEIGCLLADHLFALILL